MSSWINYAFLFILWILMIKISSSFIVDDKVPTFSIGIDIGDINDHHIKQASGLASSHVHLKVLYTHNDKGDSSRIFAINNNNGHTIAEYNINHAANYDWEDIAVGVCPNDSQKSCIYIGDIGDHAGDGSVKKICVVEEPTNLSDGNLDPVVTLHYSWDEFDCETLMIDPQGNVILVSKVDGGQGKVGWIPSSAFRQSSTYHIVNTAPLNVPHSSHPDPLGGDISPNGREVLLRTHDTLYYWHVDNADYLTTLSTVNPIEVSHKKEFKGEAVAWDARGEGYFTCSEGHHGSSEPLYYYRRQ